MVNDTLQLIHGLLYGNGIRFGKLSGNSRFIAALIGSRADRIPFMGPQIHDHAARIAKVPLRKYYWDAELLVNTQIAIDRWYRFDTYTVVADAYNFEIEALGAKFIYSDHAMPTVDVREPLIRNRSDLHKIGPLDPTKGRIPIGVEISRLVTQKCFGPLAAGFFCSPFSLLCQAMGYPNVIRAIRNDKVFAQEMFEWSEDQAILPYLKAQRAAGVKSAFGADAWSCFPNLTPEMFDEWVIPSIKRLKEKAKRQLKMNASAGQAGLDYCEEDPAKFDKEMLFRCLDVVSKTLILNSVTVAMGRTQDLDPNWLQEYALTHGKHGKKIPIVASFNGRFIRDSSPQQIIAKARQWVDVMARDGRFSTFIGNVHADTPSVNIHTAVEAIRTFGTYPIAPDLENVEVKIPQFQPFDEWLKGQPEEEIILKARE